MGREMKSLESRERIAELAAQGRTIAQQAREYEPTEQTIHNSMNESKKDSKQLKCEWDIGVEKHRLQGEVKRLREINQNLEKVTTWFANDQKIRSGAYQCFTGAGWIGSASLLRDLSRLGNTIRWWNRKSTIWSIEAWIRCAVMTSLDLREWWLGRCWQPISIVLASYCETGSKNSFEVVNGSCTQLEWHHETLAV